MRQIRSFLSGSGAMRRRAKNMEPIRSRVFDVRVRKLVFVSIKECLSISLGANRRGILERYAL